MNTFDPLIPVMYRQAEAFPAHETEKPDHAPTEYVRLSAALTQRYRWDAHTAAYSLPSIPRRLATDACLDWAPVMVMLIIDCDTKDHEPPTAEWRAAESVKLEKLKAEYPGALYYETRGGYRLIYTIEPQTLRTVADKMRWTATYLDALSFLAEEFEIYGDTRCADWTHLFRLPLVTRTLKSGLKVVTEPSFHGDPTRIGVWHWDWDATEVDAPATSRSITIPKFKGAPSAEEYTRAVEALGLAWPPKGHRHFAQLALAGGLTKAGWPVALVADFCVDVAEFVEPGTGELSKRLTAARSTAEKLATGEPIKGWPKLIEMIGEPAASEAMQALNMGLQKLETPGFVARMQDAISAKATVKAIKAEAKAVASAPTRLQVMTFLKAARDKLRKSKIVDEKHDGELLTKVIKGDFLSSHADEDGLGTLAKATLALVKVVPPGTLPSQINELLLQPAGSLAHEVPEIVIEAIEHLEQQKASIKAAIEFDTNKEGHPLANQKNIVLAFEALGATIRHDRFANRKMYCDGVNEPTRIQDDNVTQLRMKLEREFEFLPTKDLLHDVLTDRALQSAYHPILDYLEPLVWDGVPRIETWLIDAGAADTPFVRAVSKIALVAAVRRVRQPGCQYDEMLVIEGDTGCEKTSALEVLGGVWYHTGMRLDGDAKSTIEQTSGRWIIEAGELSGMARAEVSQLKNWLTSKSDTARAAYGHEPETRPRQFVLIGTTNDVADYLQDTTGNRRFWPVKVVKFNIARMREERDQLWAEAAHLEEEGISIRLSKDLWAAAGEEQEARLAVDVFELKLAEKLGEREGRLWILDVVKILELERPTPSEMMRLGKSMRRLGWEREQVRMGGQKGYAYVKGTSQTQILVDQMGGIIKSSSPPRAQVSDN